MSLSVRVSLIKFPSISLDWLCMNNPKNLSLTAPGVTNTSFITGFGPEAKG